jgi:hypothetical protein
MSLAGYTIGQLEAELENRKKENERREAMITIERLNADVKSRVTEMKELAEKHNIDFQISVPGMYETLDFRAYNGGGHWDTDKWAGSSC